MDWNEVEGNWEMLKGKVKKTWGKLTDDDMMIISGKKQELLGRLQERYGYTKELAEKEIKKFASTCETKNGNSAKDDNSCCS